jgi:predicted ATPase
MITSLYIENYKIHKRTTLNLKNLSVLTGQNSSGKSSIIQMLLLLRQSYLKGELKNGLQLQGDLCNVGLISDALCKYAEEDIVKTSFVENDILYNWEFSQRNNSIFQDMIPVKENNVLIGDAIPSVFSNDFQYISASRWSPRESYPLNTSAVEIKKQLSSELGLCDLVPHYLYHFGKEKNWTIKEELKYDENQSLDLIDQVSAWENIISKGVNVIPQREGKAFVLKYSFNKPNDFISPDEFNATNVGYGLSYALPIIVALLTASANSLIIIENPEIHLHPHGQSELAKLIARTAQMGAQIIIETHSDHIINGILVATKQFENGEKGVDRNKVQLLNCKKDDVTQTAEVTPINIIGDGKIDVQPEGFFDQTEKDLSYLLGF